MVKSDFIHNEIYYYKSGGLHFNYSYIFQANLNNKISNDSIGYNNYIDIDSSYLANGGHNPIGESRLATPKERAWLLKCIELNKFIPFDQIPETLIYEL